MKALEVIERHGLDSRVAVDALMSFYSPEFICEQLCEVFDKAGNVEDFAEFMDANFGTATDPTESAVPSCLKEPTAKEKPTRVESLWMNFESE